MSEMLVTIFNDKNQEHAKSLNEAIRELPGFDRLKHLPQVGCEEVGAEIIKMFARMKLVPTLLFVDPFGYKGLSLVLIHSVLKDWGCDCIFFFNYNRINAALNNSKVREHMNVIFGEERTGRIREKLERAEPIERERLVIEELSQALKEMGAPYVLPFCFKNEQTNRTTHHLIFATKDFKGYDIRKGIMADKSSTHEQGVPSFEYSGPPERCRLQLALWKPLDALEEGLQREFAGQTLTMRDIYIRHNVGTPYIDANYKYALTNLEAGGKISARPPAEKRPRRHNRATFGNDVMVTFPRRADL